MNKYENIYISKPGEDEISTIKEELCASESSTNWEDYYWGAKCISEYDTGDFDPALLSGILNRSMKYGLTYKTNHEYYLDTLKKLAGVYSLMGRFELALNCLSSVLEMDENAPDWVFHDLVSAQNRTRAIKKNLRNPKMFLSDLSHNDDNSTEVTKKQKNIFKEFLAAAVVYLADNADAQVDFEQISDAATGYGLVDTPEWDAFAKAVDGDVSSEIRNRIETDVKADEEKQDEIRRPLVITLFPEKNPEADPENSPEAPEEHIESEVHDDKTEELTKKLEDKQAELDAKDEELKASQKEADQLKKNLEWLEEAKKQLKAKEDENRELREKLENSETNDPLLKDNIVADVLGKYKSYEVITTGKLVKWLKRYLSYYNDWWEKRVMSCLSPEQVLKAQEGHYTTLEEFDLAALLRVLVRNWNLFKQQVWLTDDDRECAVKMFDVRNDLAHSKTISDVKGWAVDNLRKMADFLAVLNANTESKEVAKYADKVSKMELD